MKGGKRARTEDIAHRQRMRKEKVQRDEDRDAGRGDAGDLLEADALVAQFRVGELFLRRRFLAQMGNRVRISRLLCEQQQQDQQGVQGATLPAGLPRP